MRTSRGILVLCACLSGGLLSVTAAAQDGRVRLMHETIPFTDVSDAADGEDPFDLAVHFGFTRSTETATVRRQRPGSGVTIRPEIAKHEATRSELMLGLDIGLYKDLMATLRLPVLLSDKRSLTPVAGRSAGAIQSDLSDPTGGGSSEALFNLSSGPFQSPTRAGLDYVGVGFGWALINQMRDPHLPTLVFRVEGRMAIGDVMRPCQKVGDNTECGNGGIGTGGSAGSSRGINGVDVDIRMSHRYRYVEPYGGLGVLVQWPGRSDEARAAFHPVGDVDGYIHRLPAHRVRTQLGAVIIPWEHRARFQRFGIDMQVHGTYVTEGHDYSPLFDALGTSEHPHLAQLLPEGNVDPTMGGNPTLRSGGFTGLTDVEGHFRYGVKLGIQMRAAEYVTFELGSNLNWVTAHQLTSADPCDPSVTPSGPTDARLGQCAKGIINPHHRGVIDLPGRRFLVDNMFVYDLHFRAIASF